MRVLWSIGLVWVTATAFSQSRYISFTDNDRSGGRSYQITHPDTLAQWLIAPCKNDREKVSAIFHWITDNISYRVADNSWNRAALKHKAIDPLDTSTAWKSLNEMVAASVLRKRVAVCDGYARLFKTLCDEAGIPAEVITGYARTNMYSVGTLFRANHTWNAVYFDSSWHLLDATWASGYVNFRGDEFIKQYDDSYYLTPPQRFIFDHYPEDLQWTLLATPPVLAEYNRTPFKYGAYVRNGILSFSPAKGVIEAAIGDSITIELETSDARKVLRVVDAMVLDSAALIDLDSCGEKKGVGTVAGSKVRYTYRVTNENTAWLQVIYNDEAVLRYKLNIRKEKPQPSAK